MRAKVAEKLAARNARVEEHDIACAELERQIGEVRGEMEGALRTAVELAEVQRSR